MIKKLSGAFGVITGLALSASAWAVDIDWPAFKANHWNSVTAAQADAFADAIYLSLRDNGLQQKESIFANRPTLLGGGSAAGFRGEARIDGTTSVVDYFGSGKVTSDIDGIVIRYGAVSSGVAAGDKLWLESLIPQIDALGGDASNLLGSYVAALGSALSAAAAGETGTSSGRVYLGAIGYFRTSLTTGNLSFSGIEIPLLNFAPGAEIFPGISLTATNAAAGLGTEAAYIPSSGELKFKAKDDSGFGAPVVVSAGGPFTLTSATATLTLDVTVSPANLVTGGTLPLHTLWRQ